MTKHIAGFILFSFIVGVSGVIAFIFAEIPQPEKFTVLNFPKHEHKTRCAKRNYGNYENSQASVKVVQAVFNERTQQLDTDLFIEREESSTGSVSVVLHFFAKDIKGARYLASEKVWLEPTFNIEDKATHAITSSYQWLDNLSSHENLYVIADTTNRQANYKKYQPIFDENKAMAIISLKGK